MKDNIYGEYLEFKITPTNEDDLIEWIGSNLYELEDEVDDIVHSFSTINKKFVIGYYDKKNENFIIQEFKDIKKISEFIEKNLSDMIYWGGLDQLNEFTEYFTKLEAEKANLIALHEAFLKTRYVCDELGIELKINTINSKLDLILEKEKLDSAAFLTAYNPMAEVVSAKLNVENNLKLQKDLYHFKIYSAFGIGESGHREESFLVLGISLKTAKLMMKNYKQLAIVFHHLGKKTELIYHS
jgi:hypothetical protein